MRRIGVIGLGGMGTALVRCLRAGGHPVSCYDVRAEAVEPLLSAGVEPARDARELAARSDLVLSFLPGPAEVRNVALDPEHGVLAGLAPGGALLDMSTCGPDVADELGPAFDRAGRRFVDCPVSRKAPDMTVMVGGRPGVLGADEPVLAAVSRTIVYCGGRGAGYATKLLNQHVKYSWYLASAEALVIARGLGLDPDAVASAIELGSGGDSGLTTAAEYFRGDTAAMSTHAPASTIEKDMLLAEELTARAGVRSRTIPPVVDFFLTVARTPWRERPYPESNELLEIVRSERR